MKDKEKKIKATEEKVKKEEHPEEKGVQLTDEQLAQVTGSGLRHPKEATFTWSPSSGNVPVLQEPQL